MLNRHNLALIGSIDSSGMQDELINFSNAVEDTNGDWLLSHFLRGRKGSDAVAHEIGERFVLLERSKMFFIPTNLYQLNKEITFRITSLGSPQDQTIETYTFTGKSQAERQPAYLKAVRFSDSSGNQISITWQGVGRIGGGALVSMGIYFEGYRVTINGSSQDTIAEELTIIDTGGSYTITVQQINTLTGVGPAIEVTI
jgi:hypothetical protein